jgi:WD40 repeat protein
VISPVRLACVVILTGALNGALSPASTADAAGADIRLETTAVSLGKIYPEDKVVGYAVSPDRRRFVCVKFPEDGLSRIHGLTGKPLLIFDGEEYPGFAEIPGNGLRFSADGKRLAFVTVSDGVERNTLGFIGRSVFARVWVDGKPERLRFSGIGKPVFSPDGKRLAYMAVTASGTQCVVDGQAGPQYDGAFAALGDEITFSSDSRRYCYVADRGGKPVLVVDAREYGPYDDLLSPPEFSPDGKRIAYACKKGDAWSVVVDQKQQKPFDEIQPSSILFSPDGRHCSYVGRRNTAMFMVVDGVEFGPYKTFRGGMVKATPTAPDSEGHYVPCPVQFSADGRRFTHAAIRADDSAFLILDGQKIGPFEDVDAVAFSPSGKHYATLVKRDGKFRLLVDGVQGGGYDGCLDAAAIAFADEESFNAIVQEGDDVKRISVRIVPVNQ